MTAARMNVLDLLPSSRPRNPELVEQLMGDATASIPEAPAATQGAGAKKATAIASTASTTLARVPVEEEVLARKIRVSMHVTKEKHYLVRKGAAELNMSVDAFIAEAVDAALRGLSLLD
jgi:hypothetical protein